MQGSSLAWYKMPIDFFAFKIPSGKSICKKRNLSSEGISHFPTVVLQNVSHCSHDRIIVDGDRFFSFKGCF